MTVDSTQMATEFTAELQYGGTTIQTDTYSVESYCKWAIINNKPEKDLCAALLNYGGYSQTYFGSTGTKANANLSTYDAQWSDPVQDTFTANLDGYTSATSGTIPSEIAGESGSQFFATLRLESQTVIRIYFNIAEGYSKENLTFNVDDEPLTIGDAKEGDTGYPTYKNYVEIEIPASKLSDNYTITIKGSAETTGTVTYSALAYVNYIVNDSSSGALDALKNVCKALYFYSAEADKYTSWYRGTT